MTPNRRRKGFALYISLLMMPLVAVAGYAILDSVEVEYRLARHDVQTFRAELLAESAVTEMLATWNAAEPQSRTITGDDYHLALEVTPIAPNQWQIASTATVFRNTGDYQTRLKVHAERGDDGTMIITEFRFGGRGEGL